MPSSHDQDRDQFQRQLDAAAHNGSLPLVPGEYPGPVAVNQDLVIDGRGSTIWAFKGPVVSCRASRITLRNLRIEVTGQAETSQGEDQCAIKVEPGCTPVFENLEVRGSVIGVVSEEGDWRYPYSLQLGSIAFGVEHDLLMRIWVPVPCQISSKIAGLEVQPHDLQAGTNEVTLHIERISKDTLLSGTLCLTTASLRRSITVNGRIGSAKGRKSKSKKPAEPTIVYQPTDWDMLLARPRPQVPLPPPPPPPPDPSSVVVPEQNQRGTGPAPDSVTSWELTQPSDRHIQLPQPPSDPLPPVPPPPSSEPVKPPEPPVVPPPPRPGPSPKPPVKIVAIIAVLGALLIVAGFALWWFYWRGGDRINYQSVTFVRALYANAEISAVAISQDGSLIAGGGKDGLIQVWDAASGELKRTMPKPGEPLSVAEVTSLAFSIDGKTLASGRTDANVIIWDATTGEKINTLRGHNQRVNSVAFAPDGQTLASGGDDSTVKLWDVKALGGPKWSKSLDVPVKAVAFSDDGSIIAGAGGTSDGHLRLWEAASGTFKPPEITKSGVFTSLAFSKDGKLAGGTNDATVVVWDAQTRNQLNTLRGHKSQVNAVVFSPEGESLISAGTDTYILLWDVIAYGPSKRALTQHTAAVNAVAISQEQQLIVSGGADKTVKVWANK